MAESPDNLNRDPTDEARLNSRPIPDGSPGPRGADTTPTGTDGTSAVPGCERSVFMGPYYDDELPTDERERVEAHLKECPSCVADLDAMRSISARLRSMEQPKFPRMARERVRRQFRAEHTEAEVEPAPRSIRWVRWMTAAAAVLFLVALTQIVMQTLKPTPGPGIDKPIINPSPTQPSQPRVQKTLSTDSPDSAR